MTKRWQDAEYQPASLWTMLTHSPDTSLSDEEKEKRLAVEYESIAGRFPSLDTLAVPELAALLSVPATEPGKESTPACTKLVIPGLPDGDWDVVVLDQRSQIERAVASIPGSVSWRQFKRDVLPMLLRHAKEPADEFDVNAASKSLLVVAHCTLGLRSGNALVSLQAKLSGTQQRASRLYRRVELRNLYGSILGWVQAGYPVRQPDDDKDLVMRVHTLFPKLGELLPTGYQAVACRGMLQYLAVMRDASPPAASRSHAVPSGG